jgi:hypothetical protein
MTNETNKTYKTHTTERAIYYGSAVSHSSYLVLSDLFVLDLGPHGTYSS